MLVSRKTRFSFSFKKAEKKKLKKDNYIQQVKYNTKNITRIKHVYTTHIKHKIHTT